MARQLRWAAACGHGDYDPKADCDLNAIFDTAVISGDADGRGSC